MKNFALGWTAVGVAAMASHAVAGTKIYTFETSFENEGKAWGGPFFHEFSMPAFNPAWGTLKAATLTATTSFRFTASGSQPAEGQGLGHYWWAGMGDIGFYDENLTVHLHQPSDFFVFDNGLPGTSLDYDSGVVALPAVSITQTNDEALSYVVGTGAVRMFVDYGYFGTSTECLLTPCGTWTTSDIAKHTVTLRYLAEVPEPSTWTLAILGFGLAGGALRRRGLGRSQRLQR